jgi:hypothetical protein
LVRHSEQPDDALRRDRVRSSGFKSNGNTTDREGHLRALQSRRSRRQDQVPHCDGGWRTCHLLDTLWSAGL